MKTRTITLEDNLEQLVAAINAASWDDANDISGYNADDLRVYLERQDTVFVACHDVSGALLGIASARLEIKPYEQERWLYVDEVDVCADQRQRGAGKTIMRFLLELARSKGCTELWLGTEIDNDPANALYRSLDPDDVASVVGYTYETE